MRVVNYSGQTFTGLVLRIILGYHKILSRSFFRFAAVGEPRDDGKTLAWGFGLRFGRKRRSVRVITSFLTGRSHCGTFSSCFSLLLENLSSRRTRRVQHHHHHTRVVCSQLAHLPPLHCLVHQLLARVQPLSLVAALQHVSLVVLLRVPHRVHRHLRTQNIPNSISAQDQASLLCDV